MWSLKRTHISMKLVEPYVVCEKNSHEMTPLVVGKKNTHSMTMVVPYVVCEKNRHAITLGGSMCGLFRRTHMQWHLVWFMKRTDMQ